MSLVGHASGASGAAHRPTSGELEPGREFQAAAAATNDAMCQTAIRSPRRRAPSATEGS